MSHITVNMTKARDIQRDKIREERNAKLEEADVGYMQADEANDATRKLAIAAHKQELRDATADPAIDAATTPEELKAVRPACLDAPCP